MLARGWQLRILAGLALLALAAVLALSAALQHHRRGQPPLATTVDVAVQRVLAGETLDNVRLTDLISLCRPPVIHRGRHYDSAVGPRRDRGPSVLLEIPDDEECTDSTEHPIEMVGSLVDARRTWLDQGALGHPDVILRMHQSDPLGLAALVATLLLGSYLVRRGLHLRTTR